MRPQYVLLFVLTTLFLAYQNFGLLSEEDLRTMAIMNEMSALEDDSDSLLAQPTRGRDLASVRDSWLDEQKERLVDGADQRILDQMTLQLNSWFGLNSKQRTHSSVATSPSNPEDETAASASSEFSLSDNLRFTRVNSVELEWSQSGLLTCTLEENGSSVHVDYSKKWSTNTHLGVSHNGTDNSTQLMLKHTW